MISISDVVNKLNGGISSIRIGSEQHGITIPAMSWAQYNTENVPNLDWLVGTSSPLHTVTAAAKGVFCLGVAISDPIIFLNLIKAALAYLEAWGLSVATQLYKICLDRLNSLLLQLFGIAATAYRAIAALISFIRALVDLVKNIRAAWKKRNWSKLKNWFNREDCEDFLADLLRCMIYKLLDKYVDKYVGKAKEKIDEIYNNASTSISDATNPYVSITQYYTQQTNYVTKYIEQVNKMLI